MRHSMEQNMPKLIALLCVTLARSPALAQDKSKDAEKSKVTDKSKLVDKKAHTPPPKMTPEQKKEAIAASCKQEATSLKLKGEPLETFMKSCLDEPPPSEPAPPAPSK
jgi:hypothetical protein